ncbi:MAG: ATP-binding protein [Oculatellaceae cyanobacterium Prado106]|jgi:light-regulated signal transduction histidine kinase (bacteriophytochrome)|nr:ATP-binding protein [Oculatellaceae cyanobacterium Prado106]
MLNQQPTSQPETVSPDTVDLTNCDREPIHIPGKIQPHGLLFVLQEPALTIVQISSNSAQLLGIPPEALLNQPLSQLLSPAQLQMIQDCLAKDFATVNPLKISIQPNHSDDIIGDVNNSGNDRTPDRVFDGILHRQAESLILELEPSPTHQPDDFFGFYRLVKGAIAKLQNAHTLSDMCDVIVKEVRQLTDFDRVMVYQFDPEGAGRVIAEDKRDALMPFLGLHYPPSDIPKQAKQLYTLNGLRLIPDVDYHPAALVPTLNPLTGHLTDLSLSGLRSVSPIHIEYLHNMGVGASMSISLIQNKKLWGLIACHHQSAKYLTYEVRTACEFLGQVMSLELNAKEANEDLDYKMKLKSIQSNFVELMPQQDNLLNGLLNQETNLLELANAQGAIICWNDQWYALGHTPDLDQIEPLLSWVETQMQGNILATTALAQDYPPAADFRAIASGLLALAISRVNRNYILWFRPERIQTVTWGGNPNKPVEVLDNGEVRLSPRKSFTAWQQTVQGQSLPWKPCEIEAVLELRSAIVGIVLRKADELAKINLELERSNSELDSFAYIASHDLKEPLRGIHNYSSFLIEDYGHILNEDGIAKLNTLVRLTQRMEDLINSLLHFSRLGRVELDLQPTDLNELVQTVLDVLSISVDLTSIQIEIPRPLPRVMCDRVQMSEVFTNLISNAIKYNDRDPKRIEIGWLDPVRASRKRQVDEDTFPNMLLTLYVKDNGIGIPENHLDNIFRIFKRLHGPSKYGGGTGAGLTIAKKIVERHGGTIWVESVHKQGSTFYFTLPYQAGL